MVATSRSYLCTSLLPEDKEHLPDQKKESIYRDFICNPGQINFDGKIVPALGGFGKVDRLAVVLVQKEKNKILCITKTEDSTGKEETEKVKEVM